LTICQSSSVNVTATVVEVEVEVEVVEVVVVVDVDVEVVVVEVSYIDDTLPCGATISVVKAVVAALLSGFSVKVSPPVSTAVAWLGSSSIFALLCSSVVFKKLFFS
jgi:hypothetical protein